MMSCGNCGATVQDDALFCPECGAKFVEEPQAQPQPQPVAQPQPTPQPVPQPVPQPQINYAPQQPAVPQYQPQPAAMPGQMTPRQAMLRGVAGSGTMFTSAVFMTASYALSIILVVLSLVSIVTNSFIPKEIVITQALSSGTTLILTAGIAFLFCFSLFTIHSWSKRTDKLAPSFGLTVLKVFSAFGIVGISFAIMLT